MAFKDELKEKIPADIQNTPEFKIFLALVKKEDIKNADSLRAYLDTNIAKMKTKLKADGKSNTAGTMNRQTRKIAKDIDFLQLIRDKILKYL